MKISFQIWDISILDADTPEECAFLESGDIGVKLGREEVLEFTQVLSLVHARMIDPEKGYRIKLEDDE